MNRLLTTVTSVLFLTLLSLPVQATSLDKVIATHDCDIDSQTINLTFEGGQMSLSPYWIDYTITLTPTDPNDGTAISITKIFETDNVSGLDYTFTVMEAVSIPTQLAGITISVSGSATLFQPEGRQRNTIPLTPFTIECERVSLGDYVWEDLNADGVQNDFRDDGTKTGIGGVTVNLYEADESGACTSTMAAAPETTAADGSYLFEGLEKGDYCVEFDKSTANICNAEFGGMIAFSPADEGGNDTLDSDAGTDGYAPVVKLTEDDLTIDAGLYCPAKLGDRVWKDTNRDGIQDSGEPGLDGVTVNLYKCDASGSIVGGSIGTDTTSGGGIYMFNPLPPGDYAVQFTAPDGYVFSPKDATSGPDGGDASDDSDADTATGITACVSLDSNEFDDDVDAGLNKPPAGLGDRLWEDKNANGVQDTDEPGISGATVNLFEVDADGNCSTNDVFATTTTGTDGTYSFVGLDPVKYCVEFVKPNICLEGSSQFTAQDAAGTDDSADSDVDPATGLTGVIDLALLPLGDDFDETNDAGIYCPGKLGDTVWKDSNEDGIRDGGEDLVLDSGGNEVPVGVELYKCDADGPVNGFIDTTSTSGGMYMFSNLMPGSYAVKFIEPDNFDFTLLNEGIDNTIDSDADPATGITECVDVVSNGFNDTLDAGLIDPPDCGLGLVKTCEIIEPPAPPLESCQGKIQSFTMIWTGGTVSISGIDNDSGGTVINGQEVTFSAPSGGWDSNDNFLTISGSEFGESKFHVSCSDEDMDGETDDPAFPADCGKLAGDGKGTNDGFDNLWQFEGLMDADGQVVDCTVEPPVPTSSCEFPATFASCDTLPEKPTMFSFLYSGGGCKASDNSQGSKFECSGSISANSTVTLSTSTGETIANVKPGDLVTIEKDGSETGIYLDDGSSIETIVFHTSCSAPLITGELFGSLTLAALDGQGSGKEVMYSYLLSNGGTGVISDISVTDNVFGLIGTVSSLNPGDNETLTAMSFVSETKTNLATATGSGTGACVAEASATVTVLPPPPCTVSVAFKELKDDLIKYTVTNTGTRAASMDEFTFTFPSDFGYIREVKLDGAAYKADDSDLDVGPGVTISSDDWTQSDVSKRVLDPGEERTLEIKFTGKAKGFDPSADFDGTVKFNDGDCMILL